MNLTAKRQWGSPLYRVFRFLNVVLQLDHSDFPQAHFETNPTDEPITSGLPVICVQPIGGDWHAQGLDVGAINGICWPVEKIFK
jgi:hypothetical protein